MFATTGLGAARLYQQPTESLQADLARARLLRQQPESVGSFVFLHTSLGGFGWISSTGAATFFAQVREALVETHESAAGHRIQDVATLVRSCFGRMEAVSQSSREQWAAFEHLVERLRSHAETTTLFRCVANIPSQIWAIEKQSEQSTLIGWRREQSKELRLREEFGRVAAIAAQALQFARHAEEQPPPTRVRNDAAIRLLESWLSEDMEVETDTWELLKNELDLDRMSGRKLFP